MDVAVWRSIQCMIMALFLAMGVRVLLIAVVYAGGVTQTEQAIRRDVPVIGRYRYLFEKPG